MERTHTWDLPAPLKEAAPVLAVYDAGIEAIRLFAAQFDEMTWGAQTPCPEWRAFELAGHLRCVADDFHEYLDAAPVSRYARLMATGAHPDTLSRKLARQNAAELAALADAPPADHIGSFVVAARHYAARLAAVWDLPHHQYRDVVVTVGGMAGAAGSEWHLHAWDLARALGQDYRPADGAAILAGWRNGMPQLPAPTAGSGLWASRHFDPWHAVLAASGRLASGSRDDAGTASRAHWSRWPGRLRRKAKG